jgi:hypothetical protein
VSNPRAAHDKRRSSAGSVRFLDRTDKGLLISTDVDMTGDDGVQTFTNVRFLAVEDGALRTLWANYQQLAPEH